MTVTYDYFINVNSVYYGILKENFTWVAGKNIMQQKKQMKFIIDVSKQQEKLHLIKIYVSMKRKKDLFNMILHNKNIKLI